MAAKTKARFFFSNSCFTFFLVNNTVSLGIAACSPVLKKTTNKFQCKKPGKVEDVTRLGLLKERGSRRDKQAGLDPAPLSPARRGERCHQALLAGCGQVALAGREPHRRLVVLPLPRQHSEAGDPPAPRCRRATFTSPSAHGQASVRSGCGPSAPAVGRAKL